MAMPSADPTATFEAPGGVSTAFFAPVGPVTRLGFDEELRRLLRWRLILVHLLFLTFLALLGVLIPLIPGREQE